MTWNAESGSSTVSRDEAKRKIMELASEEGYKGAFKVFYDGVVIATPDSLPTQVDMSKIKISEVLDQANWYASFGWVVGKVSK
jgi:hypothetical protein